MTWTLFWQLMVLIMWTALMTSWVIERRHRASMTMIVKKGDGNGNRT